MIDSQQSVRRFPTFLRFYGKKIKDLQGIPWLTSLLRLCHTKNGIGTSSYFKLVCARQLDQISGRWGMLPPAGTLVFSAISVFSPYD
jgi:hypothetical protein